MCRTVSIFTHKKMISWWYYIHWTPYQTNVSLCFLENKIFSAALLYFITMLFEHSSPSSEIVIFNKFAAKVQFITMFLYSLYSGLLHNGGKECYINKPPLLCHHLVLHLAFRYVPKKKKKALKSRKLKQTSATALLCIFDEHEQVNPAIQTWLHTWIAGCCAVISIRCTPTHYWISFLVVCNCMQRARKYPKLGDTSQNLRVCFWWMKWHKCTEVQNNTAHWQWHTSGSSEK